MAEVDYEGFTVERLNDELQAISDERDELREHAISIRRIRDRKAAEEAAAAKVALMSDAERAALSQAIHAHGIASGEEAGGVA